MAHRADRNGMKQGNATATFKDMSLHRNAWKRGGEVKARKSGVVAPAIPAFVGKRPRLDITHVGRCFRP